MNEEHLRDTCVFILGAGASYAYDSKLPLMRGFFARVRDVLQEHQRKSNRDAVHRDYHRDFGRRFETVLDFYDRFTNTAKVKKEFVFKKEPDDRKNGPDYFNDLELLFTQVDLMRAICEPNSRNLLEDFTWVVWDVYCRFNQEPPPYGKICDTIADDLQLFPVFVTTNYDLVLENHLWRYNMAKGKEGVGGEYARFYYPGFQNFQSAESPVIRFDPDCNNRFQRQLDRQYIIDERNNTQERKWEIPIIKLHGSASWFELENNEWIGSSNFFGSDRFGLKRFRQEVCKVVRKDVIRPAIIPPLLSKSAMHDAINLQWTAAVKQLKTAKYIISVGYSFPVTDAFMQRLMSQALLNNEHLEGLYIVDNCDETKREDRKQRYRQIFDNETALVKIGEFEDGAKEFYKGFLSEPNEFLKGASWKSLCEYMQ